MPYNDIAADTRSLFIINSHESKRNLANYIRDDKKEIMLQGGDSRRGDPRHYNGHGSGGGGGQHHPKQGGGPHHGQYTAGYTSSSSGFKSGHMEVRTLLHTITVCPKLNKKF